MHLLPLSRRLAITALLLAATRPAAAVEWQSAADRQKQMVELADACKMTKASPRTVELLNQKFGTKLTPERVRIVCFQRHDVSDRSPQQTFWRFIDGEGLGRTGAKHLALGLMATPHQGSPHPHLLAGDSAYDGIQPGWSNNGKKATFNDGTMMRKVGFGTPYSSTARLFCLFNAPKGAVEQVCALAEQDYQSLRQTGKNCAMVATGPLAAEGKSNKGSPFAGLGQTGWPWGAVEGVMRCEPDMVIQAVPQDAYNIIMKNWASHEMKFAD